jgi:hypothetical protein
MQVLEEHLGDHGRAEGCCEQHVRLGHCRTVTRVRGDRINPKVDLESTPALTTCGVAALTVIHVIDQGGTQMRQLYKAMVGIAILAVPLLAMSGVWDNAQGVTGVLGGIGWFGFLLCLLALIALTLYSLGRGIYRRTTTS